MSGSRTRPSPSALGLGLGLASWLLLTLMVPLPALAHEGDPSVRTVLDTVTPPLPGVVVQVQRSVVPQMVVHNPTPTTIEVLADTGEVFLAIGPDGVFANLASPAWYISNNPFPPTAVPPGVFPGAPARWTLVTREPAWGWFEHRLHPGSVAVPAGAAAGDRLAEWVVPLLAGDQAVTVTGHLEYSPVRGAIVADVGPTAPFPQVTVAVLQGTVPGLYLENASGNEVTVRGREGEPFVRIGPRGVEANIHSPTYADHVQAKGQSPGDLADAAAAPEWEKVGEEPRYGWLESRALYRDELRRADVLAGAEPVTLLTWTVPVALGGRTVDLQGTTRYQPAAPVAAPTSATGLTWPFLAALGLATAAAGYAVAGRRKKR